MKVIRSPRNDLIGVTSPVWDLYELVGDEIKLRCRGGTCTDHILDGMMKSFSNFNNSIQIYAGGSNLYNKVQYFGICYPGKFSLTNINHLERLHRIRKTRLLHTENQFYLIEVSKIWTKAPLLMHTYCWLLRLEQKFLNDPDFEGKFTLNFEDMFEYLSKPELKDKLKMKGHDFSVIQPDTYRKVCHILENRQKIYLTEEDKDLALTDIKTYMSHHGSGIKSYLEKFTNPNVKLGKVLQKHFDILNKGE